MSTDPPRHFQTRTADGYTVVTVKGSEILPEARDEFYALADQVTSGPVLKRIVLNMASVQVLRSVSIGVLVNFQKRIREGGGALKLCGLSDDVLKLFKLIRLDDIFQIHKDEQAAAASFRQRPKEAGAGRSWFARLFR